MNAARHGASNDPPSQSAPAAPSRRAQRQAEPRRGDGREHALLGAARVAVRDGDFERMSIAELAASAGVTRPTFYFYFASKEALLATLVENVLAEISSNLDSAAARQGADLRFRIREGVEHVAAAWQAHGEILCAAVELGSRIPAMAELWGRAVIGSVEIFLGSLDVAEAGPDRFALRRQAHLLAWGQERNFYNLRKRGGDAAAFAELTADLIDMWMSALYGPDHRHAQTEG